MTLSKYDVKPTMLLGELVGTFVLATVAITVANPIIVGFTLVVLVLALAAVSGAHVNPAVTFGLWSVKKVNTVKALTYWVAQFAGAFLALLVAQMFQGGDYGISFASFGEFDAKIVTAELIAVATFTFAVAAAIHRELADAAKGLAIGFGLLVGLAIGGGLLGQVSQSASTTGDSQSPRATLVDGVVANPAIALAATEKSQSASLSQLGLNGQQPQEQKRPASRLTLETIVGGLVGGAIGMNLYFVTAGVNPFEKKGVKASATRAAKKVTKSVKKTVRKAKK